MDEAEHCHRLGFIREGRLLADGAPNALRSQAAATTLEEAFLRFTQEG
jgi:ABC-2 type transport system ATP-binding protein